MSIFTDIQNPKVNTDIFDLSHDNKLSLQMGKLVPILNLETIPGDNFKMSTEQMLRFAPMISPVMHQISVYTHFFFVPNRLVWDNWEDFITGGEDGENESLFPTITAPQTDTGDLADYMGIPLMPIPVTYSAIPFAAYQLIYNEYYRDQNLIAPIDSDLSDGNNTANPNLKELRTRAWQHDYFTSALPWTQKGPQATIPISGSAPIKLLEDPAGLTFAKSAISFNPRVNATGFSTDAAGVLQSNVFGGSGPTVLDLETSNYADLSAATASTINDFRRALKLQEWLEKNARGGSRYIESIMSHFGVKSDDARLQRPQFLGGGSTPVVISEVLQTSSNSSEPTPQGNMAGHGISVGRNSGFNFNCKEHGFIIGIMSVMPKTAYFQGLPKHFKKFDKFDYFWPSFAHIGEQPIINEELYVSNNEEENESIFGYTPRYAEYKYIPSSVHGEFKTSLDFWHMARKFDTRPNLNQTFIEADPTTRIFAVEDEEHMYAHVFHRIKASRKMPYFGSPKIM